VSLYVRHGLRVAAIVLARRLIAGRPGPGIADFHATAADPAQNPRLQQGLAVARRDAAGRTLGKAGTVVRQRVPVATVLLPVDEAWMGLRQADPPAVRRDSADQDGPVSVALGCRTSGRDGVEILT